MVLWGGCIFHLFVDTDNMMLRSGSLVYFILDLDYDSGADVDIVGHVVERERKTNG